MRLRTDFWVTALIRHVENAGALATVMEKGALEAGVVFLIVDGGDGTSDLYGPAPQSFFDSGSPTERVFIRLADGCPSPELESRLDSERRFDPDLWIVEIRDRQRRPFVDLVDDPAAHGRS